MFDVNWDTRSHADIHAQLQGRGAGFTDAGGAWNSLATRLRDVAGSVERATSGIAATRTGPAARAAGSAVGPMGPWADEVRGFSDAVGSASHEQNRALAATRGAVGPPVARPPVTLQTWEGVGALAALDVDSAENASLDAERRARAAMGRYQEFSSLRASGLPQFSSPGQGAPQIQLVTGAPVPTAGGGPAGVSTSLGPGPSGAGSAGTGGAAGGGASGASGPGQPGAAAAPGSAAPGPGPAAPGGPVAGGAVGGVPSASPRPGQSGAVPTSGATGPAGAGAGAAGAGAAGAGAAGAGAAGAGAAGAGAGAGPAAGGAVGGVPSASPRPGQSGALPTSGTAGEGAAGAAANPATSASPRPGQPTTSAPFGPSGGATGLGSASDPNASTTRPGPFEPTTRPAVEPLRTTSVLEPALGPRATAPSGTQGVPFAPVGGVGGAAPADQRLPRASYLVEDDPDALAGELPRVAPPVIGE